MVPALRYRCRSTLLTFTRRWRPPTLRPPAHRPRPLRCPPTASPSTSAPSARPPSRTRSSSRSISSLTPRLRDRYVHSISRTRCVTPSRALHHARTPHHFTRRCSLFTRLDTVCLRCSAPRCAVVSFASRLVAPRQSRTGLLKSRLSARLAKWPVNRIKKKSVEDGLPSSARE